MGLLGPIIRGVVGDTLKVTFRNKLPEHNVTMHPHGVWYTKDSEGSPYADGLPREWVVGLHTACCARRQVQPVWRGHLAAASTPLALAGGGWET